VGEGELGIDAATATRGTHWAAKTKGVDGLAWRNGDAALQKGQSTPSLRSVSGADPWAADPHAVFPAQQEAGALRVREW